MSAPDPHGAGSLRRATRDGRYLLVACALLAIPAVGACRGAEGPAAPRGAGAADARPESAVALRSPQSPGAGVLTGRLVDAGTGLAVAGAEVRLHGYGRRVRSGTDGSFRFEGVDPGVVSIRILPGPRFVPRAVESRVSTEGASMGLVRLLSADEPSWISREYGGLARGCGPTQMAVASDAVAELAEVRATCIAESGLLPAPPPEDQLVVTAVHLAPDDLELDRPAALTLALPAEPRFGGGSVLDLLRLDLDTLRWTRVGGAAVAPGGSSATAEVGRLGTYVLAVSPLGATGVPGTAPGVGSLHVAARPGGPIEERFEPGVALVYLALEYLGMDNSRLTVTTRDTTGEVVFRSERPYVGSGRDDVPMGYDGGWPAGEYVSEVAVDGGEPLAIVVWFVEPAPIAAVPYGPPRYFVPAPAVPVCQPPAGWYPHFVRAGDTLSALAARLGTSVFALRSANCLKTDAIFVGQTLYLPAPVPPAYTKPIRPYPTPRYATWGPPGDAPATEPPPISGPPPGAPVPGPWPTTAPKIGDPTLAPRPTLPPLPSTP